MSRTRSIADAIRRIYVASIATIAALLVTVAGLSAAYVVVKRDDAAARTLATILSLELLEYPQASNEKQDELIRHELEEQRYPHRLAEVWRGARRVGGDGAPSQLAPLLSQNGCSTLRLLGSWQRACVFDVDPGARVLVASALAPLLLAQAPLVSAIASVTGLVVLLLTLSSRALVARSLKPLASFEHEMAGLPAAPRQRVTAEWGASEIDQLARTFNALLGRIDEMVEREQAFTANAAHELRTPLTRLRGQLALLHDRPSNDAETSARLERATRTCDELSACTEALLALSRRTVNLDEAVDLAEVALTIRNDLPEAEAQRFGLDATEAMVRGDPALLRLAAQNLVDNALKYSDAHVELCVRNEGERCVFTVVDGGPGISGAELELVRQPFKRGAQRSSSVRGSGLGLALVDHVAALHGGGLSLENRRDSSGLLATIFLPPWSPRVAR